MFDHLDQLEMMRDGDEWNRAHHNPGDWLDQWLAVSKLPEHIIVEAPTGMRYGHYHSRWLPREGQELLTTTELLAREHRVRVVTH